MPKAQVIDKNGNRTDEVELPAAVFGGPVNEHLLYEAARNYAANQRRGTATTKTRAEVSGSNRKPWRQKGTGRARAGATRSPLWRHGGTTFGPRPKDYGYELPAAARRNALKSALAAKQAESRLLVLEDLKLGAAKTKEAAALLKGLKIDAGLLVDGGDNAVLFTAVRNIPKVKAVAWQRINTHDVLAAKWLVISAPAFAALMEKLK
jgi:large subunit ribosomal protein L4